MTQHSEIRTVPYNPDKMFDLVADVEKYPEFLPWCIASRVIHNEKSLLIADLMIGFQVFREKFRSNVNLDKKNMIIEVSYEDGPFKFLTNKWEFKSYKGQCKILFYLNFEFKNIFLQSLMERLFSEAVKKMVTAFEHRAEKLYDKNIKS